MLRFKVLASAVPLVAVALFARGGLLPGSHPCIAIANTSVEIADLPWRADLHVVVTGRNARDELIAAADLVTEMTQVKHPFRDGVKAQAGIEF